LLGFILSKLNLLILVTAIFAIIGFFAIGLTDLTKINEARELAFQVKEKTFALVSSPSYCLSDFHLFPEQLTVAGGRLYYVLAISKESIDTDSGPVNVVIFSVYPREEIERYWDLSIEPKAIAAESFRTKADVYIYSLDYDGTEFRGSPTDHSNEDNIGGWAIIDPQAINRQDTIEIIKEVQEGDPSLYIIACGHALCPVWKENIGENVVHPNPPEGFRC